MKSLNKTIIIFMNEQIKVKSPARSVIVIQENGRQWEVDEVKLNLDPVWVVEPIVYIENKKAVVSGTTASVKYDKKGTDLVDSHIVRAWLEIS